MDPLLISTILRMMGALAMGTHYSAHAQTLAALAAMVEGGQRIDDHLKVVSSRLKSGLPIDWDTVLKDVKNLRAELHD